MTEQLADHDQWCWAKAINDDEDDYEPPDDGCSVCGGDEVVYEDGFECDWVNCSHALIPCPECCGNPEE